MSLTRLLLAVTTTAVMCEAGEPTDKVEAKDILVAVRATNVQRVRKGRLIQSISLPRCTLFRGNRVLSSDRCFEEVQIIDCENSKYGITGWIERKDTLNITQIIENYPIVPKIEQYDVGDIPLQIQRSSAELIAQWESVETAIRAEKLRGSVSPRQLVIRGRIWSAVHNRQRAFEDYLLATKVALDNAKTETELIANAKEVLAFFESVERFTPVPSTPSLKDFRPTIGAADYGNGYRLFWTGDITGALANFNAAVESNPHEPLYWYYRALCYKCLKNVTQAESDARMGAFWEHQVRASGRGYYVVITAPYVARNLERLQGPTRYWLEGYRFGAIHQPKYVNTELDIIALLRRVK